MATKPQVEAMAKYCLINHSLARVDSLKKIINNPVARIRWMPRNIFAVFRVPDEVISHMSVEMFSLFIRYVTELWCAGDGDDDDDDDDDFTNFLFSFQWSAKFGSQ